MKPGTVNRIETEQQRQYAKWGDQRHNPLYWLAIIAEEVGELAQAILKGDQQGAQEELTQIAAVCATWLDGWLD